MSFSFMELLKMYFIWCFFTDKLLSAKVYFYCFKCILECQFQILGKKEKMINLANFSVGNESEHEYSGILHDGVVIRSSSSDKCPYCSEFHLCERDKCYYMCTICQGIHFRDKDRRRNSVMNSICP